MADKVPYVVTHVAVSLDGATTGFQPDIGRFYALAATWREDVTLAGADTILAQEAALDTAPRPGPGPASPGLRSAGSAATGATREGGASKGPGPA